MGSKASLLLRDEEIAEIQQETGFTSNQIIRLFTRFTALDKEQNGFLTRESLLRIPELAINPLADRLVEMFFNNGSRNSEGHVNFKQFAKTLAHFRPCTKKTTDASVNSREAKLRFIFSMYDMDRDGRIKKENLIQVLGLMVGANISNEQLNFIAERTLLESDRDEDRAISFHEFLEVMKPSECDTKMSVRFLD